MNAKSRKSTIEHILRWMNAEEKQMALLIINTFSDEALSSSLRGKRRLYSSSRPTARPITERYHKCEHCGEYHKSTIYEAMVDGEFIEICETCRNDEFFQCDVCGDIIINSENNGEDICNRCDDNTELCNGCGERIATDEAICCELDGEYYCESCYCDNFVSCDICGSVIDRNDSHYDDGDSYCDECWRDSPESVILDYDYSPRFPNYGEERRFGVEIEVEGSRSCASSLRDLFEDSIYMKHDGSLDNGFEIVTMPFLFCDILDIASRAAAEANNLGLRGDNDTCGIHVHVSKEGIRDIEGTTGKLLLLFSIHSDNIEKFARRNCERWAKISKKSSDQLQSDLKESLRDEKNTRYRAINLQPSKTIEFRIFKGTTNKDTVRAILQFVNSVIDYCEEASWSDVECNEWKDIFKSKVNDPNYKEMFEFMSNPRRGLWKQE